MRCEEFKVHSYVLSLILLGNNEKTNPSTLEYYVHMCNCEKDKKRFFEHLASDKIKLEDFDRIIKGLDTARNMSDDIMNPYHF